MAKSLNPMDAFRREQKKKRTLAFLGADFQAIASGANHELVCVLFFSVQELKKHKMERQREKKEKLATMDPEELKDKV
ncbi:hypothetical protein FI667_g10681, partial [Globisporangium splendens]